MAIVTRDQIWTPQNRIIFNSLILELRVGPHDFPAIFTVRGEKEGLISLRNLFVKYVVDDPTEMDFAEAVFGDTAYWLLARETKAIEPYLEEWRKEADVLRKRKAFKSIIKEVDEGGRSAFSAAKMLIEEPWKGRSAKTRKQVKETTQEAFEKESYSQDFKRLQEQGLIQ